MNETSGTMTSTTLLSRVARSEHAAEQRFVRIYGPMVRALGLSRRVASADCDDLEQEVIMAAIQGLRARRYDRDEGRFKAWLKGIIRHKIDHLARARRKAEPKPEVVLRPARAKPKDLAHVPDPAPTPDEAFEETFEREWHKAALEAALDDLKSEVDPATFQAFDLYARKGMPPGEVARLLGLSRNAVYIAKTRMIARLRERLGYSPYGHS